jgi:hypothetical protein
MKPRNSIDSRIIQQVVLLGFLAALPIIMVGLSGAAAVRSLFAGPAENERHAAASASAVNAGSPSRPQEILRFGVYDPAAVFADEPHLAIRHLYVSWASFNTNELAANLRALSEREFTPLVTIEPWPEDGESKSELLCSVTTGDYDHTIDRIAEALRWLPGPVYLCWGHEMDQDLTERYP